MKFVRIRPYNKARGQLVRRYVYRGVKFEVDKGWYEVDDEIAEHLEKALTFPDDPDSKPVFDVADKEGALKIAKAEYEAANPERKIEEAISGSQTVKVADLQESPAAPVEEPNAEAEPEAATEPEPEKADEEEEETTSEEPAPAPKKRRGGRRKRDATE